MSRRGRAPNGRSPIYQDTKGRWHGVVSMGKDPVTGKPIRRHVSGTQEDVYERVNALEATRRRGENVPAHQLTLGRWLTDWLELKTISCAENTVRFYRTMVTQYTGPIQHKVLQKLTQLDIEKLIGEVSRQVSPQTGAAVHRTLRASLNEALKRHMIPHNPAKHATLPRVTSDTLDPLNIAETKKALAAASGDPLEARWWLAIVHGIRQSEAIGLAWPDLNFDTGELKIRNQLIRLTWKHGCGGQCGRKRGANCPGRHSGGVKLRPTKTKAGARSIYLNVKVLELLRLLRRAQAEWRLAAGDRWSDGDFMFTNKLGRPLDHSRDNKAWHALLDRAGTRQVRLHDARHGAATMYLIQGVSQQTIMSDFGWSDPALVSRYAHVVDQVKRDATRRVDELLFGKAEATVHEMSANRRSL